MNAMDIAIPTLSYLRAAYQVMLFGSILTLMFEFFIVIITLILEATGHNEFAERWVTLSGCSVATTFLFTFGIALAFQAEGREYVRQQQDAFPSEKV